MTKIHRKVLFLVLISGNLLLSSTSAFALDKYYKKISDDNYLYAANLLNSKVEALHLNIRWWWTPPIFKRVPSVPNPRIHPPLRKPSIRPLKQELFPRYPVNSTQFNKALNDAMSKVKQKTDTRKLLSNMSEKNQLLLQEDIEDDITAKIQFTPKIPVSILRKEVQTLADQGYQYTGELYYPGKDAASQVFASRYKMRNGVFTKEDRKDAQLAAQQAIQKRRQDKVILVVSATTITTITKIAVDSAEKQVKANGGRNSRNLQRRNNIR